MAPISAYASAPKKHKTPLATQTPTMAGADGSSVAISRGSRKMPPPTTIPTRIEMESVRLSRRASSVVFVTADIPLQSDVAQRNARSGCDAVGGHAKAGKFIVPDDVVAHPRPALAARG